MKVQGNCSTVGFSPRTLLGGLTDIVSPDLLAGAEVASCPLSKNYTPAIGPSGIRRQTPLTPLLILQLAHYRR